MARRVFYSFHYENDNWRAAMVRNIGKIEGNKPASDNDWEEVKKGGDKAIEKWIDGQLENRTCAIILAGSRTANRKWINYEICQAWKRGMGVLVIYIHKLKNSNGEQDSQGKNPFDYIAFDNGTLLSSVAKAYNPPYNNSQNVYNYISENIESWIETAITIRKQN